MRYYIIAQIYNGEISETLCACDNLAIARHIRDTFRLKENIKLVFANDAFSAVIGHDISKEKVEVNIYAGEDMELLK